MRARVRGNEAGSVLLWVMVVGLFAVGALGATTRLVPAGRKLAEQDLRSTYSMIGAESAVHYVAHKLNQFTEETDPENLEDACVKAGELECEVFVASDGEYIYVTALVGDTKRNLRAKMLGERRRLQPELDLDVAVFAVEGPLDLRGTPRIYGAVGTNSKVKGTVDIRGNVQISGNVYIGPVSTDNPRSFVTVRSNAAKIGDVLTRPERDYPLPEFPEPFDLEELNPVNAASNKIIDKDGYYGTLGVGSNESLVFSTGSNKDLLVRVDELTLESNSRVIVEGPSRVYIYVTDQLDLGNGQVNAIRSGNSTVFGDPNKLVIYYGGEDSVSLTGKLSMAAMLYVKHAAITVSSNVRFQGPLFSGGSSVTLKDQYDGDFDKGIVYAPNATVHLSGGAVTGAVVGKKVFAAGNPKVTYAHVDLTEVPWSFDPADDPGDRLQWHVCWEDCLSDPDYNPQANDSGMT